MQYIHYMTIYMFLGQFYGFCGSRTTQFPSTNMKVDVANSQVNPFFFHTYQFVI